MNLRSKEKAAHKRFMSTPQISRDTQAQRYAAFLLSRDGVDAKPDEIRVYYNSVTIGGRATRRAWFYVYNRTEYPFPHRDYVPADPVHELAD